MIQSIFFLLKAVFLAGRFCAAPVQLVFNLLPVIPDFFLGFQDLGLLLRFSIPLNGFSGLLLRLDLSLGCFDFGFRLGQNCLRALPGVFRLGFPGILPDGITNQASHDK